MQHASPSPARIFMDGEYWVPATWADSLAEALREKQRTTQAHGHQFAAINDCFESLPARHAQAPYAASADAFRKHGLIATGHCDVTAVDVGTHKAACAIAPVLAREARAAHGYAVVVVRDALVVCSTPHSQSYKAMGKDAFQRSKQDVLDWAYRLLGAQ